MSGRPTLPEDVERRSDIQGSAFPIAGSALDDERAASMADEGGRSGAEFERADQDDVIKRHWRKITGISLLAVALIAAPFIYLRVKKSWFS